MIELEQVGYRIGQNWLVRDINMAIERGMLWGFVGPNGAGKSTLLRLISGELIPTTGEIRLFDKPIHNYEPKELARLRAYLQQKRDINFPFTSLEIALFGRHPHLNGTKETTNDVSIAKDALQQVEADIFEERLYPTLSGGEASRVDFARILTQVPGLFLLDEPTNHLDPKHQVQILNLCKTICGQGKNRYYSYPRSESRINVRRSTVAIEKWDFYCVRSPQNCANFGSPIRNLRHLF